MPPKRSGQHYQLRFPPPVAEALERYQAAWHKNGREAVLHLVLEGLTRAGFWSSEPSPGSSAAREAEPPEHPIAQIIGKKQSR